MKRKDYINPEIAIFELEIEDAILAQSLSPESDNSMFEDVDWGGEL